MNVDEKRDVETTPPSPDSGWVKVGSFEDREVLQQSIAKIRRRWEDRYSFKIVAARTQRESYHLYLRHR